MSQGIQIWDGAGNFILDTSNRITQIYGKVTVPINQNSGTGSIADDRLAAGTPFYIIKNNGGFRSGSVNGNGTKNGFWMAYPSAYPFEIDAKNFRISFSGPIMTWKWNLSALNGYLTPDSAVTIYYGSF